MDEAALKRDLGCRADAAAAGDVAEALARAKAEAVSARMPEALVIGADQVLALGDELFDKPRRSARGARDQLQRLRGKTHSLLTAAALAAGGDSRVAHVRRRRRLTMRAFSPSVPRPLSGRGGRQSHRRSVGAYEIEGRGIQLFERVEGDNFTIIGLPLLPLLAELRARGAIAHDPGSARASSAGRSRIRARR